MTNRIKAKVYLVGAGPGDPELLTVKALRLIRDADVVVYDRLVAPSILELIPSETKRVFVGKASGCHPVPQSAINCLIADLAQSGHSVVRLKGGDPMTFGRGFEECEFLLQRDVAFEIVPGITAASGCAAVAGIPLTHRTAATGVRFVTGHRLEDRALDLDWQGLADAETTLIVYMGLANLAQIAERLIEAGLAESTPAAAIANGTTEHQRQCRGTLQDLPARVAAAGLSAPTLVIIGRVVALSEKLQSADTEDDAAKAAFTAEARHA